MKKIIGFIIAIAILAVIAFKVSFKTKTLIIENITDSAIVLTDGSGSITVPNDKIGYTPSYISIGDSVTVKLVYIFPSYNLQSVSFLQSVSGEPMQVFIRDGYVDKKDYNTSFVVEFSKSMFNGVNLDYVYLSYSNSNGDIMEGYFKVDNCGDTSLSMSGEEVSYDRINVVGVNKL